MNEEWNEELFLQDLEFSESIEPTAIDPRTLLAVIILLSTICCCLFGGCS